MACWGLDGDNRSSPTSSPQGVDANTRFLSVSAGDRHSCGIKADGAVACWGTNDHNRSDLTSSPQGVDANARFLSVSAGRLHNCGIKADGAAVCWGFVSSGRTDPASSPQGVDANARFLAVSASYHHSCGVKADGRMACWGVNLNGETDLMSSPQGVDASTRFLTVSAGRFHTCGITANGAMACWGFGGNGRTNPASAAGVDANTRFLAVGSGHHHSCGIKTDYAVACWGFDGEGQASPPPGNFARTPDLFSERITSLTTEDGEKPVQFNEVTEVEVLRPQIALREGETTTLALFRALSDPANPVFIALAIEESGTPFLSISPAQLTVSEKGATATASITAIGNDDVADIEPINIMLSVTGDNTRLTPTETIAVTIEDDDIYAVALSGKRSRCRRA